MKRVSQAQPKSGGTTPLRYRWRTLPLGSQASNTYQMQRMSNAIQRLTMLHEQTDSAIICPLHNAIDFLLEAGR
jgi:hypothetical protein